MSALPGETLQTIRPKFKLIKFDDILLGTTAIYRVKGIIPRVGLVLVWGPPKCGKSFWVFDMVLHVALGWEYRGHRVEQGPVVYCALEGGAGFKARVEAFRVKRLSEDADAVPFYLVDAPMGLVADAPALIASIRVQIGEAVPAVIVVDTVNRSLNGSESKDEDMAAYVRAADAIRDAFGCVVILVHHSGVDASRPRGHTSLTGAADAQLAVKRDGSNNVTVTVEWMKDGPEGEVLTSKLEPVEVGRDDYGDPISSCVVVPLEGAVASPKAATKLPKAAQIALRALNEALAEIGNRSVASAHVPAGTAAVTIDQWRDYAMRLGISTSDKPSARRMAFDRATQVLISSGHVAMWDPYAWVAGAIRT
jgi:hypothetical protein